jgi:FkbM family methyltransferase
VKKVGDGAGFLADLAAITDPSGALNRMEKSIRKLLKLPLTVALRTEFFRKRVAFYFRYEYFADLELNIPLSHGFWCPVLGLDALYSFSEIFVSGEYGSFLDEIPLPRRWLDLGCHIGYFTLYLAWQHAMAGSTGDWRALLIDADPRSEAFTKKTLTQNSLLPKCEYRAGLISKETGELDFALREGMGSSADTNMGGIQRLQRVRVIRPAEILAAFPPPYDLIKIDVEGAESDFIEAYRTVHVHTAAILMEWHSPDREGSNEKRLRKLLEASDFSLVQELRPRRELQLDDSWYSSGVQLYRRASA